MGVFQPKVLFADPEPPGPGYVKLYRRNDEVWYEIDDQGVVRPIAGISSGVSVGDGTEVYQGKDNGILEFRSIKAHPDDNPAVEVSLDVANETILLKVLTDLSLYDNATTQYITAASSDGITSLSGDVVAAGPGAAVATIQPKVVTHGKIQDSSGYSVLGRSTSTTGSVADIIVGPDELIRRNGSGDLVAGKVLTGNINDTAVTYAKIQDVSADRLLGRVGTSGVVQEIELGTNLSFTGTVLNATGGGGGADELNDLADVTISAPQDGDILVYDAFYGLWGNSPQANEFGVFAIDTNTGYTWGTSDVVADQPEDTATLVMGNEIIIETDATGKAVMISHVSRQQIGGTYVEWGCNVIWLQDLDFEVTAGQYRILGVQYTTTGGTVTLDAADVTHDRFDAIIVDNTGSEGKITGTASATPQLPVADPTTQVILTYVSVPQNATQPGGGTATNDTVYDENLQIAGGEWDTSQVGTAIDYDFASNTYSGSKCMRVTTPAISDTAIFEANTALDPSDLDNLNYRIRLDAGAGNVRLRNTVILFKDANSVNVGSVVVSNNSFGYQQGNKGAYQLVSINYADFTWSNSNPIKYMEMRFDQINGQSFNIDVIQIQGSFLIQPPQPGVYDIIKYIETDSGTFTASGATDTLPIKGANGIVTSVTGGEVIIDGSSVAGTVQNLFETIALDSDSGYTWGSSDVVAASATEELTLVAGTNITLETDATNKAVRVTSTAGGGGHEIQDDGTPLTQRAALNFVGATVTDDSGNDATVVDVNVVDEMWFTFIQRTDTGPLLFPDDYEIEEIILIEDLETGNQATAIAWSIDGGSYSSISLPLGANLAITGGETIKFRTTHGAGETINTVYMKGRKV
jgi:hypothetical protein